MDARDENTLHAVKWEAFLKGFHHDTSYMHGYVTTEADVETVLELYKRVTSTTFCVRTSSPLNFDPRKVDRDKCKFSTRSFQFSKSSNPQISVEGVPFTHGGKRILECQFGPKREHERKRGGAERPEAPGRAPADPGPPVEQTRAGKARTPKQETRKRGCEAKITVLQICMLPGYAVTSKKMFKVLQINAKERLLEDLCEGQAVQVENRYYMDLPLPNAHSHHTTEGLPGVTQALHPQVTEWIGQLVAEGVTEPADVQATLRHHVRTRMSDVAAPSELDRAYYPQLSDIKGHVSRAKARLAKQARGGDGNDRKRPCKTQALSPPLADAVPDLQGPTVTMEPAEYAIIDIKAGEPLPFSLACEDHATNGAGEDGDSDGPPSLSEQEVCLDAQGDVVSGTFARKKSTSHAKASIGRTRRKAHEELEILRAMTHNCTHGPALESLTESIRALQHTFTKLVDPSPGPASPRGRPRKRKQAEPTAPPLSKASARDRSGHATRKRSSAKADSAKS